MRISDWSSDVCSSDLLKARGDVVITTEIVLLGRRDIVDPVVAVLVEAREADRKAAVVGSSRRDLDLAGAIAAIADARMAAGLARLDGIERADARRGVSAEQSAFRSAQPPATGEVGERGAPE